MLLTLCVLIAVTEVMSMKIRSYRELRRLKTFEERFNYLRLDGKVGAETFGFDRYLNQIFYTSERWLRSRDEVIIRDRGCDLGIEDYEIVGSFIVVHHMNPVTVEDVEKDRAWLYDPEFLITTSDNTHRAIHYRGVPRVLDLPKERRPNDTTPWL